MATNGEPLGQQRGRLVLALAGLGLATSGVLLSEPLLTLSKNGPDKVSMFLPVYAYLFLLNPLTFYCNMLLFLLHVIKHAGAPEAPLSVFSKKHLPRAAHIASLATLLLSAPLTVHVSVAEGSVNFAIGAALQFLALVTIFTSVSKLICGCHAGRGFMLALFALCISTGTLISFDPLSSFSDKNQHDPLVPHVPIHLLLLSVSFLVFMLGITLLLLYIGTQADGPHAAIHAKNLVIAALRVATATLLVGWYVKIYMAITGMGAGPVEAVEL